MGYLSLSYTGRGARTTGLVDDGTRSSITDMHQSWRPVPESPLNANENLMRFSPTFPFGGWLG